MLSNLKKNAIITRFNQTKMKNNREVFIGGIKVPTNPRRTKIVPPSGIDYKKNVLKNGTKNKKAHKKGSILIDE